MGMVATFMAVSDKTFRHLEGFEGADWFIDDEGFEREDDAGETQLVAFKRELGEGEIADLDKAWHGLHYCLTGDPFGGEPPLDFILAAGEMSSAIMTDVGVRFFFAAQVAEISSALAKLTVEDIRANFDPEAMTAADLYPQIWDIEEEGYNLEYVENAFGQIRDFAAKCAETKCGFVVWIG